MTCAYCAAVGVMGSPTVSSSTRGSAISLMNWSARCRRRERLHEPDVPHAERRDDRVDADREIGHPPAEVEQLPQALLELLEVSGDAADEVVLLAHAVEREVHDDLALGAGPGDALHPIRDRGEDGVAGDVDDARPAVPVDELRQLHHVRVHERLAAADREPVGRPPQRGEHPVPLLDGELVLPLHPDVAGEAARVAPGGRRQGHAERQQARPAGAPVGPEERDPRQHRGHRVHGALSTRTSPSAGPRRLVVRAMVQMAWSRPLR